MHTSHQDSAQYIGKPKRGLWLATVVVLALISLYLMSNSLVWAASVGDIAAPEHRPQPIQAYKTASQWKVASDQVLTYTIHVRNLSMTDTLAQVTDPLPPYMNYVADSVNFGGVYDAGTDAVAWNNVTVPRGSEVAFSFAVTATAVTTPTGVLNIATITTSLGSFASSVWVLVIPDSMAATDLSPSAKYAARMMVTPGDSVPYAIKLINMGTLPTTADVTDPLPLEMNYVSGSASEGGVYDRGTRTLFWHAVAVPALGQVALSYVTTATTGIVSPTWVVNTATIAAGVQLFDRKATVLIVPHPEVPPHPLLAGSYKKVSQRRITTDDTLTYTIKLVNSGAVDALVNVTDPVPPALSYVENSANNGGVYDSSTQMVSWSAITVPAASSVHLAFAVMATGTVTHPTLLMNTATISVTGDGAFRRQAPVWLLPTSSGDQTSPIVHSVTIGDQDVLTSPTTTLHISATDNISVSQMFIREWQMTSKPFPHWTVSQSSGWVPYQTDYPWTLLPKDGTHFVGVWVADADHNVSDLDHGGLDFASLVQPNATVEQKHVVPYLVYYPAGVTVTAQISATAGDADLYVWYPHNFFWPDRKSLKPSPGADLITFTTLRAGIYLFLVRGYTDATYDLSIDPSGGPRAWPPSTGNDEDDDGGHHDHDLAAFNFIAPTTVSSKSDELTLEPLLSQSGVDPLVTAPTVDGLYQIYLPAVVR
jgi:uncharacterized repeat protein (TIGR01451 family)